MSIENPYWYKLLDAWRKKPGKTGLTLPFVVGAGIYLEIPTVYNVETLFEEINKYNDGNKYLIRSLCPDIGEAILSIREGSYGNLNNTKIIYRVDEENKWELDTEHISDLAEKYNPIINDSTYSLNGNWHPFNEDDINFIEKIVHLIS